MINIISGIPQNTPVISGYFSRKNCDYFGLNLEKLAQIMRVLMNQNYFRSIFWDVNHMYYS